MELKDGKVEASATSECGSPHDMRVQIPVAPALSLIRDGESSGKSDEKRFFHRIYRAAGAWICIPLFIVFIVSAIIYIISMNSVAAAEFFSAYPASALRFILALLTSWFPFSLGEALVILLPFAALIFIISSISELIRNKGSRSKLLARRVKTVTSLIAAIAILFVFTLGTGYNRDTIGNKLSFRREAVSAQELHYALTQIYAELNPLAEKMMYSGIDNMVVLPYPRSELFTKLNDAYRASPVDAAYLTVTVSPKQVALSVPMTYTLITGVYTFFTGEANVNTNIPGSDFAFTAAHEMAHQRGIAREDEANFAAFIVCISSDDDYIRYSGLINAAAYLQSALYSADRDLYKDAYSLASGDVKSDMYYSSVFFNKYISKASEVSSAVNNAYLSSQKQEGVRSYGLVTDLIASYYKSIAES